MEARDPSRMARQGHIPAPFHLNEIAARSQISFSDGTAGRLMDNAVRNFLLCENPALTIKRVKLTAVSLLVARLVHWCLNRYTFSHKVVRRGLFRKRSRINPRNSSTLRN